jgi:MFS family permease
LIGPALSGFVLASYGASFCFLSNTVSFIAVIGAIAAMKLPKENTVSSIKRPKGNLRAAIDYLNGNRHIGTIIIVSALSNFFVLSYATLLPVYAKDVFKGDATTYGWLNSAVGVGAFAGAFYLALLDKKANFRKIVLNSTFLMGASLLLFAYSHNLYLSLVVSAFGGFSAICQSSAMMTIVQTETDAAFRGRIVSFIAMSIFGMLPLGSLLLGYLTPLAGVSLALFVQGIAAIIIGILFFKKLYKSNK